MATIYPAASMPFHMPEAIASLPPHFTRRDLRHHELPDPIPASPIWSEDVCAICLEGMTDGPELQLLPCIHIFHRECIDPWIGRCRPKCPVCFTPCPHPKGKAIRDREVRHQRQAEEGTAPLVTSAGRARTVPIYALQRTSSSSSSSSSSSTVTRHARFYDPLTRVRFSWWRKLLGLKNRPDARRD